MLVPEPNSEGVTVAERGALRALARPAERRLGGKHGVVGQSQHNVGQILVGLDGQEAGNDDLGRVDEHGLGKDVHGEGRIVQVAHVDRQQVRKRQRVAPVRVDDGNSDRRRTDR